MELELNKEQWQSWREHPVTQFFFQKIQERREEVIQRVAYTGDLSDHAMTLAVGQVGAYTHVMNTTFED